MKDALHKRIKNPKSRAVLLLFSIVIIIVSTFTACSENPEEPQNRSPSVPSDPSPLNGAGNQETEITLSWQCSDPDGDPLKYDIYFGTDKNPPLTEIDRTSRSYNIQQLESGSTYYWRILAKDNHEHRVLGDIWQFTTTGTWSSMNSGTDVYLWDVWGSSWNDVFVVGGGGVILHYDGTNWSSMNSGVQSSLYGVWGNSWNDVFVVGDSGIILYYDGTNWSSKSSGVQYGLYGVWGSSGNDVFFVGASSSILHYDGNNWSSKSSGQSSFFLWDLWGSSGSDIFAVGEMGLIIHYDDQNWSVMYQGPQGGYSGIWGSSGDDVFAVGSFGTIFHYNGSNWSSMDHPASSTNFHEVWGSSRNDVFAVGGLAGPGTILHYNGLCWEIMYGGNMQEFYGIWGSSPSDVFAVGIEGTILHYGPQ